jgi:hypothetical protein
MTKPFILKFEQCAEQKHDAVCRIVGFISASSMLVLLDNAQLSANPRLAKAGSVTSDIIRSLGENHNLFPFKTKGLLLASTKFRGLERQRFEISFLDPDIEGILDGGHNALGIGLHVLASTGVNTKGVKSWDQFTQIWQANRQQIEANKALLDFLVPIELLVPSNQADPELLDQFSSSLVDICEARNNNVSLTDETQANKRGFYEALKEFLPEDISKNIEWRSNAGGRIKPREIVALAWVTLSYVNIPNHYRVNPNQIYRNKGHCVEMFSRMMEDSSVSNKNEANGTFELYHEGVKSALKALGQLPRIYDYVYENLPEQYNKAGGSFGKISAVRMFDVSKTNNTNGKYLKIQPTTPFFEKPTTYTVPDGFIVPLVYALRRLLKKGDDGTVLWSVDPTIWLQKNLGEVMKSYRLAIEMAQWDPQKVGKNINTYDFAEAVISAQTSKKNGG